MVSAIVGRGPVGSDIRAALDPDDVDVYHSKNIEDLRGKSYDVLYVAAPSAVKWVANQRPAEDLESVLALFGVLRTVRARRIVHFSTIDAEVRGGGGHAGGAYGEHRARLEELVLGLGTHATVIRLPALFGPGLKKNALFDLLQASRALEQGAVPEQGVVLDRLGCLNLSDVFQWYDLDDLFADAQVVLRAPPAQSSPLHRFYSAPLELRVVVASAFPELLDRVPDAGRPVAEYRFPARTPGDGAVTLAKIRAYVAARRCAERAPRLAVSAMAWDVRHDAFARFVLERRGVRHVELVPTKYAPRVFLDPAAGREAREAIERAWPPDGGVTPCSAQALFYGSGITDAADPAARELLLRARDVCSDLCARYMVVGAPGLRRSAEGVAGLVRGVEGACLENTWCEGVAEGLGRTPHECARLARQTTLDIGSWHASGGRPLSDTAARAVAHVQVSRPGLGGLDKDYVRAIRPLAKRAPETDFVVLEVRDVAIESLDEQVRLFITLFQ